MRACHICGKPYTLSQPCDRRCRGAIFRDVARERQKQYSREYRARHAAFIRRQCPECSKEFSGDGKRVYCSPACRNRAVAERRHAELRMRENGQLTPSKVDADLEDRPVIDLAVHQASGDRCRFVSRLYTATHWEGLGAGAFMAAWEPEESFS